LGRVGRKGERSGKKKTLYISHRTNELLKWAKKAAKRKGTSLSESQIVDWIVLSNWKEFCKKLGLHEEEAKSEKERKKLLSFEEQFNLTKKQFVRYAQETSEERYTRDVIFGNAYRGDLSNFAKIEPSSVFERILGWIGRRREDDWQEVE